MKHQIRCDSAQEYAGNQQPGNSESKPCGLRRGRNEGFSGAGDGPGQGFRIRSKVRARFARRGLIRVFRSGDKGVTSSRNGLHKSWLTTGITKELAQFIDGSIHVRVVIDVPIRGPEASTKGFASNHFAALLDENQQDFEDLGRQRHAHSRAEELLALQIKIIGAETDIASGRIGEKIQITV